MRALFGGGALNEKPTEIQWRRFFTILGATEVKAGGNNHIKASGNGWAVTINPTITKGGHGTFKPGSLSGFMEQVKKAVYEGIFMKIEVSEEEI